VRERLPAVLVALGAGIAYGVLSLRRYAQVEVTSWDLAIFEQALQGYAQLSAPIVDVKGPGFHILGDHFSPIYAVLAPVYRVVPGAQVLLLAQVVLVAVSAYVVTALAVRHLGRWRGVTLGACYALSFGVQSAIRVDFHEVAFAAPLLALAGAAWVERRPGAVVGWSLPLLLVKEDLGLTVAVIGALLWWTGERRRGPALVVAGVGGFLLTVLVVLPAFNDGGAYAYTGTLGGDRGVLATAVTALDTKLLAVVLTVAITGFAALFSPWALLALPTFAWRFTGDVHHYWGTDWHYSLVLMPIVFCAAIDAIKRRRSLRHLVPVAAGVTAVTLIGSPLASLLDADLYRETPRAAAVREAVDRLPDGASVETDIALLSHVVTDHEAYWTGTIDDVRPEYVLFDTGVGIGSPRHPESWAERTHGGDWRTVYDEAGIVLVTDTP
jgi:uncharacterized membrane protein